MGPSRSEGVVRSRVGGPTWVRLSGPICQGGQADVRLPLHDPGREAEVRRYVPGTCHHPLLQL